MENHRRCRCLIPVSRIHFATPQSVNVTTPGSPYRSGKSASWRKTVCTKVEHFAVIDVAPRGGPVRSLKLARLVEGKLTSCGWVGSGLTEISARKIRTILDAGQPIVAEVV